MLQMASDTGKSYDGTVFRFRVVRNVGQSWQVVIALFWRGVGLLAIWSRRLTSIGVLASSMCRSPSLLADLGS